MFRVQFFDLLMEHQSAVQNSAIQFLINKSDPIDSDKLSSLLFVVLFIDNAQTSRLLSGWSVHKDLP